MLLLLLLLLALCLLPAVQAFGARLEPLPVRAGIGGGINSSGCDTRTSSVLRASRKNHEDNDDSAQQSSPPKTKVNILGLFDFPPAVFENLDHFELALEGGEFLAPPPSIFDDGTLAFLREEADAVALETFADCGEECEECDIPADWKLVSAEPVDEADAMNFLGIKRAKPIWVPNVVTSAHEDWQ